MATNSTNNQTIPIPLPVEIRKRLGELREEARILRDLLPVAERAERVQRLSLKASDQQEGHTDDC